MSQDSKVFFRIFLGIGLVLILISVVVFYNQFTYSKDAIHTEGVIVDTETKTTCQGDIAYLVPIALIMRQEFQEIG